MVFVYNNGLQSASVLGDLVLLVLLVLLGGSRRRFSRRWLVRFCSNLDHRCSLVNERNFFFYHDLDPKVKGQNWRSKFSFRYNSWTDWPILSKFSPYNQWSKLFKKIKFVDFGPKVKGQFSRPILNFAINHERLGP